MQFSSIKTISGLEKVSKEVIWQHFEKLVGFIFEENGFNTKVNVIRMINKYSRRQYDVIAEKQGKIIIAECKKWAENRYRLSGLKTAIKQHKERCLIYNKNAMPIIVTLIEEEIKTYDDVPIRKLNSFVND